MASTAAETRIAFVGTYPPRRCGIATFTRDLAHAMGALDELVLPMTLAMTDPGGQYEYSEDVKYELRQAVKGDYTRAAEFVNFSDVRLVSIQHEYGIFGGDDGAYILDFLTALRVPAVVTLHTVLKDPSSSQRAIVKQMAKQSAGLVVMSRVASDLLARSYGIEGPKVHIIAHGIPEMESCDPQVLKTNLGIPGQRMLITFGLLGPNKGVETVLHALPALVGDFPDLVYFVVGATHPMVVRRHGEAYRTTLEREAEKLGVRKHVVFRDQFVTIDELCRYLQAADIFISPYRNEAQVTSGALCYAMGAGTAAISTPYWHAQEMLADGRGCLFPFGDSVALSKTVASLLSTPSDLARVRSAAFEFTRSMVWPRIARAHLDLNRTAIAAAAPRPLERKLPSSLPELRLDHLRRMTDDTGIIQHASYSVPARRTGYCVDDNARALIVALEAEHLMSSPETMHLVTTYLGYLHLAQNEDGSFNNFMRYDRTVEPQSDSGDCQGRAMWALGMAVRLASDEGHRLLAQEMFERGLARTLELGPRGTALTMVGLVNFLAAQPGVANVRPALASMASKLATLYQHEAKEGWRWFEPTLTYDNAMLPLALFKAYSVTGERVSLRIARESLEFLEGLCFAEGQLVLVGNAGWHSRGGSKAHADEQAIDATAFVLAYRSAYLATGDHHYLQRMRESFAWFLGANRLGIPLYDFVTAGCRDGLGDTDVNHNEGAESTVSFLLALLEMLELAGEGLERPAGYQQGAN